MRSLTYPRSRVNNRPHLTFKVYVLREGSTLGIAKGSGVVGRDHDKIPNITMIDYEGNLYGAENLRTHGERVMHAAGRASANYPTVARMGISPETMKSDFIEVGTYDYHNDVVTVTDAAAQALLDAWLAI